MTQTISPPSVSDDLNLAVLSPVERLLANLPDGRLLLTVTEAAEALAVKPFTIYQLCKTSELTGVYPGPKTLRIRPDDLVAYVDALGSERPEPANASSA